MTNTPRPAPLILSVLLPVAACAPEPYDTILQGGRVLDGTGSPALEADVAIRDGLIAAVGDLGGAAAGTILDVTGLYVSPGFIDTHSHAGPGLATEELSHGEPLLAQGLTTVVVNPDGGGPVDLAAQRTELEQARTRRQRGTARRTRIRAAAGAVQRRPGAHRCRAGRNARTRSRRDGDRCMGSLVGHVLRPRQLRGERGTDRTRTGGGGVRRDLHQPHPGRVQLHHRRGGGGRGGDRREPADGHHGSRDPHQGAGAAGVGFLRGHRREDRRGPCGGAPGLRRPVPLPGFVDGTVVGAAAPLVPGRGGRCPRGAGGGPRHTGPHPRGDGGEPGPARRCGPDPVPALFGGPVDRRAPPLGCGRGTGRGPRRYRVGADHPGWSVDRFLQHERGGSACGS